MGGKRKEQLKTTSRAASSGKKPKPRVLDLISYFTLLHVLHILHFLPKLNA
jgi:hypothetical protein